MANNQRTFPEISFVDTNTERLRNSLILAYERFTDSRLYAADPRRKFIEWITDIIIQERIITDESAKQNVPRFAEGIFLDSLAEIFNDIERLPPQPAKTKLRFYISAPQQSIQIIPEGTRVTVNGDIIFSSIAAAQIKPGKLYGDAEAVCITTETDPATGEEISIGAKGNGFIPGQISQIIDLYSLYEKVENITTSAGGADRESDEAFRERMRDSMGAYSTAGPLGAYIYWVKTASARIVDVKPTSPSPGVADIRVLLEDNEPLDEEMKKLILDTINDDRIRPFTDFVQVSSPDPKPFSIDVTYFIPRPHENSMASIIEETEKAVAEYIKWQTERMGRDINPDRLIMLMKIAGVKRTEVRSPVYTVVGDNEVAQKQSVNVIFGGVEDE